MNHPDKMARPKRPRSVTFLALGVLIISGLFWLRFAQAIQLRDFIRLLEPNVSLAYLVTTGLIFGIAGLPVAWGLWLGKPWAPDLTQGFSAALAAWYWLDRILLVRAETVQGNWPFALTMTALLLVTVRWVLSRRQAAAYFEQNRENPPENGDTDDE